MGRSIKSSRKKAAFDEDDSDVDDLDSQELETNPRNRTVFLTGDVTEKSAGAVIARMTALSQMNNLPIRFVVNTYGGDVYEAMAIYDTMRIIRAPIRTVGVGKIMSAGVLLLAAGEKGHRIIGSSARVMIHNGYAGFHGDAYEVEAELREFKKELDLLNKYMLRETKLKKKELEAILDSRLDHYVTAEQAIEYGIADKLI